MNEVFIEPLISALGASVHTRPCPELSDADWLRMGVLRVLEASESGRAFLQEHGLRLDNGVTIGSYFVSLKSTRRENLVRETNLALIRRVRSQGPDRLVDIPELAPYECFAADGHWHKAAAHDARHEDTKMAVGHFYSLDLRFHILRHLAAGQGLHEHDMSALKRVKPKGLRQGVPRGTRVLIIYDKAGIDLDFWKRCRHETAVYFISRPKDNMEWEHSGSLAWDKTAPCNRGVIGDYQVTSRQGHKLRRIDYLDPQTSTVYEFLTNEPDLSPGVIAELYRRRWEVEKVFDQVKNKLGQQKAWASSLTAKTIQAQMIALTHNLLLLYEQALEDRHGIVNEAEDRRRTNRTEEARKECAQIGIRLSSLALLRRRATQRSVKFIRWLRQAIRDRLAEAAAVPRLRLLYAQL